MYRIGSLLSKLKLHHSIKARRGPVLRGQQDMLRTIDNMIYQKMELFTKSLVFASVKHQTQRRKNAGDIPYINHPLEVVHILASAGVTDYQVLAAGALHDTVEDTNTTPQQLEKEFSARVKDLVMQCTDDKSLGKAQRKRIQIKKAEKATDHAKLVKMADKISNNRGLQVEAPPGWSQQRVIGYFIWSQLVCNKLRGVNEILDKEMEDVFEKSGINRYSAEQKQVLIESYYSNL